MIAKSLTLRKALPYILIVCGIIGVFCSFTLTLDKIQLLEHPNARLNCSINPIIACGSVVSSDQGHAFGFPNPFLGLAGFSAMITVGMVLLAGAKLKRWFWLLLEAGTVFALGFVHWLFYESVYRVNALCLYCMAVWVITITSFWYVTLYNIDEGHIVLPNGKSRAVYNWVRRHHLDLLVLWFALITFFTIKHFWYYFGRNL